MSIVNTLTPDQVALLWSGSSEEVAKKFGLSSSRLRKIRRDFLRKNKDFNIPPEAKYSPRPARKRHSSNKPWSVDDLAKLWIMPGAKLAKLLGRSPHAVYLKRIQFLNENPDFEPPASAIWRSKSYTPSRSKPARSNSAPVKKVEAGESFKMTIGGKELELPKQPKRIKIGDIELEF